LNFILSSCVSGAPEEILHDGKKEAHPTEMQVQLGHTDIRTTLDPDYRPGSGKDGEPSHKLHTRLGSGG
jgi:hypothetical protein